MIRPGDEVGPGVAVGGKAAGLLSIVAAGLQTPAFFVLPASAHRRHLRQQRIATALGVLALELEDAADAAHAIAVRAEGLCTAVLNAPLADAVSTDLCAAARDLGPGPFAVRSSMVGEDSRRHSFAGQLATVLQCPTPEDVPAAVKRCWASAYTEHALTYAVRHGLAPASLSVAVVVQQMVDPDVAGVLFTADPASGRRDHCRVAGTYGLGEGVVSGQCAADEFTFDKGTGLVTSTVAHKATRMAAAPGGGVAEADVPADRRDVACLSEAEVQRLCTKGIELEAALGQPLDIEWAVAGGDTYFLQARPVTSALAAPAAGTTTLVWDNSNIQESFCGVTTPLTFSFASYAYETVFVQTCKVAGLSDSQLDAARPLFANLIGFVDGRVYYNLASWYASMKLLPSFGLTKENFERAVGVTDPVDFVEDEVLTAAEKLARTPRLTANAALVLPAFARLRRDIAAFHTRFETTVAGIDREGLGALGFADLFDVFDRVDREISQKWTAPIINDFMVQLTSGAVARTVEAHFPDEADAVVAALFSANDGIESVEPTLALFEVAAAVRADATASAAIGTGTAIEGYRALRSARPDLALVLDAWIERYGDRCMGELKLETVSLRQDPTFLGDVLRGYVARPDLSAEAFRARERDHHEAAVAALKERVGARRWSVTRRVISRAREAVRDRESMRLTRTRLFGLCRDIFVAMGARLSDAGRLDEARDVFWLTLDELRAHNEGRAVTTDLAALVAVRKAEYERYHRSDLANRFETGRPPYDTRVPATPPEADDASGGGLHGIACYPGVVEAEARVVTGPGDAHDLGGKVLVAVRTDPGWTPLFPTAAGILVERGSSLSHSAVVARELGIPAVVGIDGLTASVRDGDLVRMDGTRGTVEVISPAAERRG